MTLRSNSRVTCRNFFHTSNAFAVQWNMAGNLKFSRLHDWTIQQLT
jgi:hypothetical protein